MLRRLAVSSLVAAALAGAGPASAAVPQLFAEQGRLFDTAGAPLAGNVTLTFALYAAPTGGAPLWTEVQTVTLDGGYYSVQLGAVSGLSAAVLDGSVRYLGITVGSDAEMAPRATVASVPYALLAGDAVGDLHPHTVSVNGTVVIDAQGHWVGPTTGLAGATGPTGPQGVAGAQGPQGPVGPQGVAGATGPQGPAGAAGPTGPQGAAGTAGGAGATGPQGPAGNVGPTGPANPILHDTTLTGDGVNVPLSVLGGGNGGGGGVTLTAAPCAQLEAIGPTFAAGAWTPITWNAQPVSNGIVAGGSNVLFPSTGVYRITTSWRAGAGGDDWTAVRLFGGGAVRGLGAGTGNTASNDPQLHTHSFLASVPDASVPYTVDVGRRTASLVVSDPQTIVTTAPAAVVTTAEKVADVSSSVAYAELEGPAMTFAANAWTSAVWSNAPVSNGVSFSGGNLGFASTGVYRVTLSWRVGTAGDVWTAIRLASAGGVTKGVSAGSGTNASYTGLATASFLATVDDTSVTYAIQMGRLAASDTVTAPLAIAGVTPPALQATVQRLGPLPSAGTSPRAYAQLEGAGQTWAANLWTSVGFNKSAVAAGVTFSGNAVTFSNAGYYKVTLSHRTGSAADVWTGIRLINGSQVAGVGPGTGSAGPSNLVTYSFIAAVTSTTTPYLLQIGRITSGETVGDPLAIVGTTPPAVQATFEQL
jgi:hypothetical protein